MEGKHARAYHALSKEDQEFIRKTGALFHSIDRFNVPIGKVIDVREARKRINVIVNKRDSSLAKEEGICQMCGQKEDATMHTCKHCKSNLCHQCLDTASSALSVDFEKQIAVFYCESCVGEESDTELETGQYFTM